MSVRKRTWTTRKGETKEAWIVDYAVNGSRHIETFERKKDADARVAQITVDVGKNIHIAPSKTPTVAEAGRKWLEACEAAGLERSTADGYEQHLRLHIVPYLGTFRLAQLTAPLIRQFEDDLRAGKLSPEQLAKSKGARTSQRRRKAIAGDGEACAGQLGDDAGGCAGTRPRGVERGAQPAPRPQARQGSAG